MTSPAALTAFPTAWHMKRTVLTRVVYPRRVLCSRKTLTGPVGADLRIRGRESCKVRIDGPRLGCSQRQSQSRQRSVPGAYCGAHDLHRSARCGCRSRLALRLTPNRVEGPRTCYRSSSLLIRKGIDHPFSTFGRRLCRGLGAPFSVALDELKELRGAAGVLDESMLQEFLCGWALRSRTISTVRSEETSSAYGEGQR
jgi:hypothetical protein